jgi:hypothetical protein
VALSGGVEQVCSATVSNCCRNTAHYTNPCIFGGGATYALVPVQWQEPCSARTSSYSSCALNSALTTPVETQSKTWEDSENDDLSNVTYDFRIQYNESNFAFVLLKEEDISPHLRADAETSAYLVPT